MVDFGAQPGSLLVVRHGKIVAEFQVLLGKARNRPKNRRFLTGKSKLISIASKATVLISDVPTRGPHTKRKIKHAKLSVEPVNSESECKKLGGLQ